MKQKWNFEADWLKQKYINEQLSTYKIAQLVGCSNHTVSLALRRHGIQTRTNTAAQEINKTGKILSCSNGCGKTFYRKKSRVNKFEVFFCSWECSKEYRSKTKRKVPFSIGWRRWKEYRKWRSDVIRRDKCCKICGKDIKLVVHHILEAQDCPELIFDLSNGVTLCQSCHISIHKQNSINFIKPLQEAIFVENQNIGENLVIGNSEAIK